MELRGVILVYFELLESLAVYGNVAKEGIEPDYNGGRGKTEGHPGQALNGIAQGLTARDDGMEENSVPLLFQQRQKVVFREICPQSDKGRRAIVHNDVGLFRGIHQCLKQHIKFSRVDIPVFHDIQ